MDGKGETERREHQPARNDARPKVELRQSNRIRAVFPIECHAGDQLVLGWAENIGQGGVLVRANKTLPWDEIVSLSFVLPGSTDTLQLRARVAHVVVDAFMGMEFLDLPPEISARIE